MPISGQTCVHTRSNAAGVSDYPCLQGYLVGPPGKKIAVRLQVGHVCVVQCEGTVHCAVPP